MGKSYQYRQNSRYRQRDVDTREIRQRFLIVCEGGKTEPNYFIKFRTNKTVINIEGLGCNTISLVTKAIELMKNDDYNQVWCVFDRDIFPPEIFNAAFELASRNGIKIAYSNESFELWYFLHFDYLDTALTRDDYCKRLNKYLGRKYEKNDENMYEVLLAYQPDAIRNAKILLKQYNPSNPVKDNPSTTVHLLVEELNRFNFL